jgi:glutamate dehydrogenase
MPKPKEEKDQSQLRLQSAMDKEMKQLREYYEWLENNMPPSLFKEIDRENLMLIAHSLMGFPLQEFETQIELKEGAIVLRLDSADADLKILKRYQMRAIKKYRAFVSKAPPPIPKVRIPLRIAIISFSDSTEEKLSASQKDEILSLAEHEHLDLSKEALETLVEGIHPRFLLSLTKERLTSALRLYLRAKTRDLCQYEVKYNEGEEKDVPSVQILFAWRNVPKRNFIYRIAKTIHRHGLVMSKVNAAYINPMSSHNILIMSLGLDGQRAGPAWKEADIDDLLKEIVTIKYFEGYPQIEEVFVESGLLSGNYANFLKAVIDIVHQFLVHIDINNYAIDKIEEAIRRHPELAVLLTKAFELKFHPEKHDIKTYIEVKEAFIRSVDHLDTGNEINDVRRKNVLKQAFYFIDFTLKTNYYCANKTGFCFRIDPAFMTTLPYNRAEKFPELPYAIFFMKGRGYIGFHIRFKDLSRGGLRTVCPQQVEQMVTERNNVFSECYNLSYTQQKKNKDIPEGGSKGVIFLEPYEKSRVEEKIYRRELEAADFKEEQIEEMIGVYHQNQKLEAMYHAQRSYIGSLMVLVNCEPDGTLRTENIVDYWKQPEYIYFGPDENMHNIMIDWIASYSKKHNYKPGMSFISSKPTTGINHKEFGVTSLSVSIYMEEVLKYLQIDPAIDPFTVKLSGGPDGDVAGNLLLIFSRLYPKTAKVIAITDISGTIYEPEGLDLKILAELFKEAKPIRNYPAKKLTEGGFLLDIQTKKEEGPYAQKTLCYKRIEGKLVEEWLTGSEMNHLHRHNVHQAKADIFIPAGGRPRTLNETNYIDFLDETGKPTAKGIVEGANLYLTPNARIALEDLGVILIKDSSANKGGVICSSFEVLIGLVVPEEEFLAQKMLFVDQILDMIRGRARDEALLMLKTYGEKGAYLTDISEWISERINTFTYQILDHLQSLSLSNDPHDPLIKALINYCLPYMRENYVGNILKLPEIHKKAIIACYLASRTVYQRGLDWHPTIADVLPLIARDPEIVDNQ